MIDAEDDYANGVAHAIYEFCIRASSSIPTTFMTNYSLIAPYYLVSCTKNCSPIATFRAHFL